jgi:hypothetical protein
MYDYALIIWMILTAIGAATAGIAALLKAFAWITWARRCHPKGTFKHPVFPGSKD